MVFNVTEARKAIRHSIHPVCAALLQLVTALLVLAAAAAMLCCLSGLCVVGCVLCCERAEGGRQTKNSKVRPFIIYGVDDDDAKQVHEHDNSVCVAGHCRITA